jgi:hypothetical protein
VGRQAGEFFEDDLGCLGPDEWLGLTVVFADVAADGLLQIGDRFEHPWRVFRRVMMEKKPSTALSHEADVGVKWKT